MKHENTKSSALGTAYRYLFLLLTAATGLVLAGWGFKLARLGGSAYYLIAGISYLIMVVLYFRCSRYGLWLSVLTFVGTIFWALSEVGFNYWQLLPRLVVPALIFMLSLWLTPQLDGIGSTGAKRVANGAGIAVFVSLLATIAAAFFPHGIIRNDVSIQQDLALASENPENPADWRYFGRSENATKFAPYSDITPENVSDLEVAWTYKTGRDGRGNDANTLQQIGGVLYSCTPLNVVSAIDADTGEELWKFDPEIQPKTSHLTCRGVGYYDAANDPVVAVPPTMQPTTAESIVAVTDTSGAVQPLTTPDARSDTVANGVCVQRILVSTVDANLWALDAHTGKPCQDFGNAGKVDLKVGMGETQNGRFYHPTAAPTVAGNLVIIGGWVMDIAPTAAPGVVRAFDARTGKMVWAWDPGNPDNRHGPKPGQIYTFGTPNVWGPMSFDLDLGLVFMPTGNGPTDYWGGARTEASEKYGSAVVALDLATGEERWVFQLVHHDVWDYDTPSQPTLYTLKDKQGEDVPALIQTSKSGQIFVLDRRTGKPIYDVEEKPVPQEGMLEGERLSPTQPFSVELPAIATDELTEEKMWGLSTFDQLWCRIDFKQTIYQGMFPAPQEKPYIQWPALLGALNWGGITVDESRGLAFVNSIEMAVKMSLKRREDPTVTEYDYNGDKMPSFYGTTRPQDSGPYGGLRVDFFESPLAVPCTRPPFGTLSAIDLKSKQLVWQVPLGTAQELGPKVFGKALRLGMPMPIGMPSIAGSTATASGLVFFAGTQDKYIRAFNSLTGEEVWRKRLPVGAAATPIVYRSPKTGKQYVAISAGGIRNAKLQSDEVIAYALPD